MVFLYTLFCVSGECSLIINKVKYLGALEMTWWIDVNPHAISVLLGLFSDKRYLTDRDLDHRTAIINGLSNVCKQLSFG